MADNNETNLDELLAEAGTGELEEGALIEGELDTEADPDLPAPYLRDLSEDDVYDRLSNVKEFPNQLSAMESRFNGSNSALANRVANMEKATPTQVAFDVDKLSEGLKAYDPKLAEVLVPLMQEVFKVNALDENTLRPFLDNIKTEAQGYTGEQIVMANYSPEALDEIIPPVQDGKFAPAGQRHTDFTDWYAQQGYKTQQALLNFGAPYVHALRKFEKWEATKNEERTTKSKLKTERLAKGQTPSSSLRKTPVAKQLSEDELFESGFNEATKEVNR